MDGEHPEWLPVDWRVCVRVRSSGKKDKYYVNPSNELKFNSKPEVLRYLKNVVKDHPKERKLNEVDEKTTLPERLPSRWNVETRITRQGVKTRRDPTLAGAEGQKLINEKVNETSSRNERVKSESAAVENENLNPPKTDAAGGTEKEKDSTAEDEQQKTAAAQKKRKKNSKWMNGLPRRASKRLARVEADPPLEVETSNGARESAKENNDDTINTCENLENQKEATTELPVGNTSSAEEQECASVDLKQEDKIEKELNSSLTDLFTDPCIEFAIKTLTGAIPLEELSKMASPVIQASSSSSVLPVSDIWADPCFEFAVKTLTSEIPAQDDSHFQISFNPFPKGGKCL